VIEYFFSNIFDICIFQKKFKKLQSIMQIQKVVTKFFRRNIASLGSMEGGIVNFVSD